GKCEGESVVNRGGCEVEGEVKRGSFEGEGGVKKGREGEGKGGEGVQMDGALRDRLARAVLGLTGREAERVLRRARIKQGGLKEGCVTEVVRQKRQIVRASGTLEFCEPGAGFDDIGGLENLKVWFNKRRQAFTSEGARFGLRSPRGAVLVGVPGCGKSLSAKALAREWEVPLLRLDMGRIRGSRLGESEARIRQALQTAELVSPCVLWIDELEKAFAGAGHSLDGGAGERVFGAFLSWLEEKTTPVFVVATANDIASLPPEFTRKGRFDEMFFVGLPNEDEREAIWRVHLRRPKMMDAGIRSGDLVALSDGHTGAEIAEAVVSAMYFAFSDSGRPVCQNDMEKALKEYVPLSVSHGPMISRIAAWGLENARPASG
ncbi:AAA family ATPase, partial [bacterium]|nr:AAA family ATPase [bacterium]